MQRPRRPGLIPFLLALTSLQGCCAVTPRANPSPCGPTNWAGIYPTVLTPTTCTGIDTASLDKQIQFQLGNGVHGLLILGTIGEGHRLSADERGQVIASAVKSTAGKVPLVVGIHTSCVNEALRQMRQAKDLGAAAVLVKFHGKPKAQADEVLAFYTALSDSGLLPIFFYHYPSDTGLSLSPHTIAAILRLANVVGIKESTFNLREIEAHICLTRDLGKAYFSGSALDLTQFLQAGGSGAMCPEAALLPRQTVAAFDAWQQGDSTRARAIQNELYELVPILRARPTPVGLARAELMFCLDMKIAVPLTGDPNPAELKYALNLLGVSTPIANRPPERPLRPCEYRQIERAIRRAQDANWACPTCSRP